MFFMFLYTFTAIDYSCVMFRVSLFALFLANLTKIYTFLSSLLPQSVDSDKIASCDKMNLSRLLLITVEISFGDLL